MITQLIYVQEGLRMFFRHLRVRGKHFKKYSGNAVSICNKILRDLYTGSYYKTSTGHYPTFYARDFGMVVSSLLDFGKRREVKKTLQFALACYKKHNCITTFITPRGYPVNFPAQYSPDSFAYILRSIRLLNDAKLTAEYKTFLQEQLNIFVEKVVDTKTGLVIRHKHFSAMRDHSKRDASCYDTVMVAVVAREANLLGLNNPLKQFDYEQILLSHYWTGSYFKDDMSSDICSADANIFPLWFDIISSPSIAKQVVKTLQEKKLDKPFPIRYVSSHKQKGKTIFIERLVSGWEANMVWPMSGLPFIEVVAKHHPSQARKYLAQYTALIERLGTFPEVLTVKGVPFKSAVYSCDEGMIWSALYLKLLREVV